MVEAVGGGHVAVLGAAGVHLRTHFAGQHLTQLHSPLVERIDPPDEALLNTRTSDVMWPVAGPSLLVAVHLVRTWQ